MPKCYCHLGGCAASGGREISKCIYDSHTRTECSARIVNAQAAGHDPLQEQEEAITSHLAAMTLSDQVSGASPHPGGRLWSKSSSPQDLTENTPSPPTFSHRERIDQNLKRIRDLEISLDVVRSEATSKLVSVGSPLERTSPFPLRPLIVATRDILDQLDHIKQKVPSVQESKKSVVSQTQELLEKLKESQRRWLDQAKICPIEIVPDSPYELNTG